MKQGKPPRATSLTDFLGAGYLTLLGKVIKANREQFADLFASNRQVDEHLNPLVALRNELAHPKELLISSKVRSSGEPEVRWFAEKLGLDDRSRPAAGDIADGASRRFPSPPAGICSNDSARTTSDRARNPMTLFDAYLAVDWSAKSSPTPKEPVSGCSMVWRATG